MVKKRSASLDKWFKKGLYTVEISIILPFLAGIILLLFYLGFYLNDRFVLEEAVSEAAIYAASNFGNDTNKIKEAAYGKFKEISAQKLFVAKNPSFVADVKHTSLVVSGKTVFDVPLPDTLKSKIWGGDLIIKYEGKSTITRPVKNKLIVDKIKGVAVVDKSDETK